MKKNLFFATILCIGLLAIINSCVKDTFTEQDAYDEQRKSALQQDSLAKSNMELEAQLAQEQALLLDSLKKVGGVINYSVGVVVASESSWWTDYIALWDKGEKSQMGLDGAVVTLAQHGRVFSVTTGADGIASFKDLRVGTVNVNITKTGYTEVDFVVDLPPLTEGSHTEGYDNYDGSWTSDTSTNNPVNLVRHAATMVPVFSLTDNLSTVSGKATVETDLTNDAPEVATGIKIKGIIDVEDYDFWAKYIYVPDLISYWDYSIIPQQSFKTYYGKIKQIAFNSTISSATTDANGLFTMQVPSTPQGLPISFEVDQFAADQKILLPALFGVPVWGVQTVRTLYGGYDFDDSYTPIPNLGLGMMNVQSAYVTFSAPTGAPAAQPTTTASATAVLTSSGVVSVNITDPGEGYTQAPKVEFEIGSAFNSVKAEGTAVISNGKVTGVTITSPGTGYKPDDNPAISFTEGVEETASYEPEFTFSVVDINVTVWGNGYSQTAPAVTITGTGTGATAHAEMAAYLKSITVTAPGSGYTQPPVITIADNFSAWDGAVPVMTTNNPLFSIAYNGTNTTLWPASPLPTATVVGDGAGATASVTLSTTGKVTGFTAIVPGSGYTSNPVVTLSGGGGFGATATATQVGGVVTAVNIVDQGQGYTSVPTVTISGGGGTGAGATAVLGFPVATISMTAAGNGYNSVTAINVNNGGPNQNYLGNCVVKYNMGLRNITFTPNGWFYSAVPTITITPRDANGSGAAATAAIQWEINDIVVDNPGSGYKHNDEDKVFVKIDAPAGTGTQATAEAVLGNGKLAAVKPWTLGEGYTAVPNVYLRDNDESAGPIKQAKLTATVSNGHVTGLTITDPGEGYDYSEAIAGSYDIEITTFNSDASAVGEVNPESGKIAYITVDNTGSGYAVVPEVEIYNDNDGDANGFGTGAVATAVVTDGRVSAINVTNAGSGYYSAPNVRIVVVSSVKTAMGRADVSADGRILGVDFNNPGGGWPGYQFTQGYGYETPPTVTFTPSVPGKGAGAAGIAQINNGQVTGVIMTNQGSGYTGRNKPLLMYFTMTDSYIYATAGKSYIIDIYFGTGKKTVTEQGIF